ncbi:hypothetical protein RWE15_09255 [Virgibacillus halophilus]|uniref:Uncharacterized protein n=1 Tax=Tigheibacillus halophilus TaxID=361280 RepID=A0ABU5C7N8_9BACI|nr:hypothetical protein [Virgibacillus halophilus]
MMAYHDGTLDTLEDIDTRGAVFKRVFVLGQLAGNETLSLA